MAEIGDVHVGVRVRCFGELLISLCSFVIALNIFDA
jgi:hypothetical protein